MTKRKKTQQPRPVHTRPILEPIPTVPVLLNGNGAGTRSVSNCAVIEYHTYDPADPARTLQGFARRSEHIEGPDQLFRRMVEARKLEDRALGAVLHAAWNEYFRHVTGPATELPATNETIEGKARRLADAEVKRQAVAWVMQQTPVIPVDPTPTLGSTPISRGRALPIPHRPAAPAPLDMADAAEPA